MYLAESAVLSVYTSGRDKVRMTIDLDLPDVMGMVNSRYLKQSTTSPSSKKKNLHRANDVLWFGMRIKCSKWQVRYEDTR